MDELPEELAPQADPVQRAQMLALLLRQRADSAQAQGSLDRQAGQLSAFGNLGLLTGDRVLAPFGQSLLGQAQNANSGGLRGLTLQQGQDRLALQAQAEARKAGVVDKELGLKTRSTEATIAKQEADVAARQKELTLKERELGQKAASDAEARRNDKLLKGIELDTDLRKEFDKNPVVADYNASEVNFESFKQYVAKPSAAGDLAIVFGTMKDLDPTSVVKEGEQIQVMNTTNLPARALNYIQKVNSGQLLNPAQRKDLLQLLTTRRAARQAEVAKVVDRYRGIAGRTGANVENIIPKGLESVGAPKAPAATAPAPAAGAFSRPDRKFDPTKTVVRSVASKDGKWLKQVYSDGTVGLGPNTGGK